MFRWFAICLLLAATTVALVAFITQVTGVRADDPKTPPPSRREKVDGPAADVEPEKPAEVRRAELRTAPDRPTQVTVNPEPPEAFGAGDLVVQGVSVVPMDKQDVPAEKDGKLIFLATEIDPAERDTIPKTKLITQELGFLAIQIEPEEFAKTPENERVVFANTDRKFRRWKEGDPVEPGHVVLARQLREFRRLGAGDKVKEGQLLALVNPALALDELSVKIANLDAADAERLSSKATKEESEKRLGTIEKANLAAPRTVPADEVRGAQLTIERYRQEEVAKTAAVWKAQREINQALTALRMHEIRAAIPGTVKSLYKGRGDAVKALESVMQIQDPNILYVEGKVEAQEARHLREMLRQAKAANKTIPVTVDASQMEAPKQVLKGHLHAINGVAVSGGAQPLIVSAGDDCTVRVWARAAGRDRWYQHAVLTLDSEPLAVACSPRGAKANLLVVGTRSGSVRLFNLDNLQQPEQRLSGRRDRPVLCVAFSPDGSLFAAAGADHSISLWDAAGEYQRPIGGAHADVITSLQFATPTRLVSAGRDGRMVVWDIQQGRAPARAMEFDRRTNDVPVLGVSPDGETVLIDLQSEQMRMLALKDGHIVGALQRPPNSGNFATLALFSPDGKTVLTNSTGSGRGLQLWRTESQQGRGAEVRQFVWTAGAATCGAFSPDGKFAVTGTADNQVLVWAMPDAQEVEQSLKARLTYVEDFLDSSSNKVQVRAELDNPGWIIPGPATRATLVIPFAPPAR
jgi:WD40 repeat protein